MTAMKSILAAAFVVGSAASVTAAPTISADSIFRSAVEAAALPLRGTTDEAAPSVIPGLLQLARGGSGGGSGGGNGGNSGHNGPGHDGPGHDGPGHDGPGHDGPGHDGPGHDGPGHDGPGHSSLPSQLQFARGGQSGHGGHGEGGGHG